MKVFIGADHRGFNLKSKLIGFLRALKYEVYDCGALDLIEDDDYIDYAVKVASHVVSEKTGDDAKGISICGSGMGVCIAANKIDGIRCGLGFNVDQVIAGRNDDDINMLAIAADYIDDNYALQMVKLFLESTFNEEERYMRRIQKLKALH